MNALSYAIRDVQNTVSKELLHIAYSDRGPSNYNHTVHQTLDNRILMKTIRPRVLIDCNLVGGVELIIPISKMVILENDYESLVVEIPKSVTGGRDVISAHSVIPSTLEPLYYEPPDTFSKINNNISHPTPYSNAYLEVIGDNVVKIHNHQDTYSDMSMSVLVENDSQLNNINPRTYPSFSKLATLAVKAFIYNELHVKLDKGYIHAGHDLGVIRDIVDSYSESDFEYREYLTGTWAKISLMNDSRQMDNYIMSAFPNSF